MPCVGFSILTEQYSMETSIQAANSTHNDYSASGKKQEVFEI